MGRLKDLYDDESRENDSKIQLGSPWTMLIGPGANYACEIASLGASPALPTPAKFATLLRSIKQPPSYFIPRSGDHSG